MSKRKRKTYRGTKKASLTIHHLSGLDDGMIATFTGEGCLPLTDELIERLHRDDGIPKDYMIKLRNYGAVYNPLRKSFPIPDETRFSFTMDDGTVITNEDDFQ